MGVMDSSRARAWGNYIRLGRPLETVSSSGMPLRFRSQVDALKISEGFLAALLFGWTA